jgi:hypothetical protein
MSQHEAETHPDEDSVPIVTVGSERVSRRTTIFLLASLAFALLCVVLALQFFVAERIPEVTEAEFMKAKKLWLENGPANYDMDVVIRGAQPGSVHIEVRNKVATAMTRDGITPAERTWDTWSVPGMFETLDQDMQIAEDPEREIQAMPGTEWRLRCEFDPELGIPRVYHRLVTGGGPEVYWRVTRFDAK